ncbi:MraY family glycosyltransferase [Thermobifida fusca]|uniref:Putative teichoic acid linkage unit synthesis (Synthesis of undecaprenylpyrophosphate-N-aetylglucosamine ) n=2 Tax=Thermobifida fusca TaxID=2021 RepID=Q47M73_THEFY|nr:MULTISPECIES: MraY family glycosyltransferase [Thermobifida]AAZ56449.1 putative teichoic acid linkage unit synthesis (synthesis of undecaprenylpyrophosphate-N-aetylglucosamine) [Thermobifida fusca YX]MBO2530407.1 undecaprenyl/decaprenyl-phosphate alpha-N-acetylglucosaminyl 1-phosphate transferase [Thermobifida sp.]PPS91896.1 UDP-N-acetylmuramyl pentapeptide phosphotransferase [Thermobifida fusca]PZN61896.1 MAG: undecaprenyl/decaprenyl-phosphate alpha-N-acetylglucosaminyl 1-phosphate transfer
MREYALTFVIAVAVTHLLTPLVRSAAIAFGAVPPIRDRDVHTEPIPRMGGLAMYGGFAAALLISAQLPHLREVFFDQTWWRGLLVAGALIVVIGIIDDRWGMAPVPKLAGQIVAAGILVSQGVQLLWLPLPGTTLVLGPELGTLLSVLLIVVTINAINFADGLDGLASGIVAIAAAAFFTYYYVVAVDQGFDRQSYPAMIAIILVGVCTGFLIHNFNPARVFMGDTGSMLIGLLLASITITVTGEFQANAVVHFDSSGLVSFLPILLPLLALALPLADLVLAVVRRTLAGKSPFAPDKKHLHHRLLELGHSHARAVLLMYLWAAIISFAAVSLSIFDAPAIVLSVTTLVAICAVGLITLPRLRRRALLRAKTRLATATDGSNSAEKK